MKRLILATILVVLALVTGTSHRTALADGQPTVTRAVAPLYPPIARQAHVSTKVVVEVKIDSVGKVASVKAVEGHPLVQKAAENAAKQWLFVSGVDGRVTRLTFTFIYLHAGEARTDKVSFIPPYEVELLSD